MDVAVQITADAVPLLAGLLWSFYIEVAFYFPNQFGELAEGHAQIVAKKGFLRHETGIYLEGVEDAAKSFINGIHSLVMCFDCKRGRVPVRATRIWKDFAKLRKLFYYKKFP